VLGRHGHHADGAVAGQRVLGHLAIARLEQVERRLNAWKQHDVVEGKEREGVRGAVHVSSISRSTEALTQRRTLGRLAATRWIEERLTS
jgi:hypothetical protein